VSDDAYLTKPVLTTDRFVGWVPFEQMRAEDSGRRRS
jgi:hypothetical protein